MKTPLIQPKREGPYKRVVLEVRNNMFFADYQSSDPSNPLSMQDVLGIIYSGLKKAESEWLALVMQGQMQQQAAMVQAIREAQSVVKRS